MRLPLLLAALALPCAALAQSAQFPLKLTGQHGGLFKGRTKVAIGSYGINYIIAQRASAVAGIGLNARVETGLAGVDEATMRRLANEGYADLRAQLAAAGITLASEAETKGALQGAQVVLLPGNTESGRDGGMVIGKGVKKANIAFGADAAPLTDIYPTSGKVSGFAMLGALGKTGKLNKSGEAIDATWIFPLMTVDYADTEAKTSRTLAGSKRGSVSSEIAFGIRMESPINVQNPFKNGMGTPGVIRPAKDVWSDADFALGANQISATATNGQMMMDKVREGKQGAVTVDPAKWTALVRDAYRAYNAAIVAAIREAKAKG